MLSAFFDVQDIVIIMPLYNNSQITYIVCWKHLPDYIIHNLNTKLLVNAPS